ncbi:MAG: PIN domain-containing protein [Frankiaceae bacterium]
MYRAVLDTCALMPGRQRDFLLQLATEEAYAPLWGSGILFELDYVLARLDAKRGRDGNDERRQHLFEQMKRAFPEPRSTNRRTVDTTTATTTLTTGTSLTLRSSGRQTPSSPMTLQQDSRPHAS